MIIFTHDIRYIEDISKKFREAQKVFNFTSYHYSSYDNSLVFLAIEVRKICAQTSMKPKDFVQTVDFDILYANYIFNNNDTFQDLMKVMFNVHEGVNVIILVERDEYRDALMESLIKLIQQRYGYNCWIVENIDDLDSIKDTGFSDNGIKMLEEDIKRLDNLIASNQAANPLPDVNIETVSDQLYN